MFFFGGPVDFLIHWPPGPVVATVQCHGLSLFCNWTSWIHTAAIHTVSKIDAVIETSDLYRSNVIVIIISYSVLQRQHLPIPSWPCATGTPGMLNAAMGATATPGPGSAVRLGGSALGSSYPCSFFLMRWTAIENSFWSILPSAFKSARLLKICCYDSNFSKTLYTIVDQQH